MIRLYNYYILKFYDKKNVIIFALIYIQIDRNQYKKKDFIKNYKKKMQKLFK